MLVTQGERKRPGLADGMMSDKGKKTLGQKLKAGIKGKREETKQTRSLKSMKTPSHA
jgi:hypothetical protein